MNLISKCNCCMCEPVCKFKSVYEKGIESILNATIPLDKGESDAFRFWRVKDCPHIDVSIKCPHMITKGNTR